MRPWFIVPPPTDDMKCSMLGSGATRAATCCWWRTMASYELPSRVSVVPLKKPVSSFGMNPFGTRKKRPPVPRRIAAENASPARR